jgi:hypothetical protein
MTLSPAQHTAYLTAVRQVAGMTGRLREDRLGAILNANRELTGRDVLAILNFDRAANR